MNRPPVTVVMPFFGSPDEARGALQALQAIDAEPHDELILVDNSPAPLEVSGGSGPPLKLSHPVTTIRATSEWSPAHARNAGAAQGGGDWILFLDADCRPFPNLLRRYFAEPIGEDVGALAGEVLSAPSGERLVARYGAARSFLGQRAHMEHPYRPRAAAANLLVRRRVFEQLGGFLEGVRAAEDTDFSWRLQENGWRLELRPEAAARHIYRGSLSELRRQWRGYAAGRAWLARRYEGFRPQSAIARLLRGHGRRGSLATQDARDVRPDALSRCVFLALDGILAFEELAGLALSNRPSTVSRRGAGRSAVVVLAESFPVPEDPLVELAGALEGARVEALRRPERIDTALWRQFAIEYLEDDGLATRVWALAWLLVRHPVRCAHDRALRGPGQPPLLVLAPGVRRLAADPGARVLALSPNLGGGRVPARIARLAGRRLDQMPRSRPAPARRLRVR